MRLYSKMGITIIRFLTAIFVIGFPIIILIFWGEKFRYNFFIIIILIFLPWVIAFYVSKKLDKKINKTFLAHLVNDLNYYANHNRIIENYSDFIVSWKRYSKGKQRFYEIHFSPFSIFWEKQYSLVEEIVFDSKSGKWKLVEPFNGIDI